LAGVLVKAASGDSTGDSQSPLLSEADCEILRWWRINGDGGWKTGLGWTKILDGRGFRHGIDLQKSTFHTSSPLPKQKKETRNSRTVRTDAVYISTQIHIFNLFSFMVKPQ